MHIDNKNKVIFILSERETQGLDDTRLTAEDKYSIMLHNQEKDLYKVYAIMGATISYLLKLQKYIISKQDYEINNYTLCLGNISKGFTINNMKKNRIKRKGKVLFC